jgi:hypothetical protein
MWIEISCDDDDDDKDDNYSNNNNFIFVFWDVLSCNIIVDLRFRGTCCFHHQGDETSVDSYFTRQYIPEDKSELHVRRRENLKSHNNNFVKFICYRNL